MKINSTEKNTTKPTRWLTAARFAVAVAGAHAAFAGSEPAHACALEFCNGAISGGNASYWCQPVPSGETGADCYMIAQDCYMTNYCS